MDYIKKTILLTNDNKDMSILNINRLNNGVFANFKQYGKGYYDYLLVISVNGKKIYKQNIYCKNNAGYDFKLSQDFDLNSNIACALYKQDDYSKPVAWGINGDIANYKATISEYINNLTKENMPKTIYIPKENSETNNLGVTEGKVIEEKEIVDEEQEDVISLSNDLKEESKEVVQSIIYGCRDSDFEVESLSKESLFETNEDEVEAIIDKEISGSNFFDMISDQIDDLFANYPTEDKLERVVPNSRWVKVDYNNNGRIYVIGLVYELESLKYVAYGVPARQDDPIPASLDEYSQWIPLDVNNPNGEGYFVMFQDAENGDTIKL